MRRWLKPAALPLLLLVLNLYIAKDLFFLEYGQFMGSIEAAYIAISRYMIANWSDLTWFPLWYGGIPFQNTYPPFLHAVVALVAAAFRISIAHSHHIVTAFFYCCGPIALYALAVRFTGSRWCSFCAVWIYSIFSPCLFLMPLARAEVGGAFVPRRFEVLAVYGEGPHITVLALLPVALLILDLALSKRSPLWYVVAAISMAAVALTNWLGAFALAVAVFAYLLAELADESVCPTHPPFRTAVGQTLSSANRVFKTLGLALLAYALACPWIPPSTILDIRHNAQTVGGDYQHIYGALPIYLSIGILAAALLKFAMHRAKASTGLQFSVLFAFMISAIPLGVAWFHLTIVPQPERYQLEMDLALCLAAAFAFKAISNAIPERFRTPLVCALLLVSLYPVRLDRRYARRVVKPIEISSTIEYEEAKWFEAHVPNGRVMAPGAVSFWLNAFTDVPQIDGGFSQGMVNRTHDSFTYQIFSSNGAGDRAAEIDRTWLIAYGAQAIAVGGKASRELYKPFQRPDVFANAFPEALRDRDDAIYWVPGRSPSLAHVLARENLVHDQPIHGLDITQTQRYVQSFTTPASFHWTSRHSAEIDATLQPERVISVQETYHPGWRALANGKPCRIFGDGLGQIVLEPRCNGACKVELIYDGGLEMKTAKVLSGAGWLGCIGWILVSSRKREKRMSANRRTLIDSAIVFLLACWLIAPLFKTEYIDHWGSIESTFIADARMLRDHLPHPAWQPLWYCGTRFDYIYPPALRYGTAFISLTAGISTARAYHVYTAFFYALGIAGVYLLAFTASRSRMQAWIAALGAALLSPALLFMDNFRIDSPFWVPQRLHVLAVYGEGPHISSLSILGFALAASLVSLRAWRPRFFVLSGFLCAAVVATNFYGATALALLFPILTWATWLEVRSNAVWLRAAGIASIAYGLCAFWLTPSYIRITRLDMKWVADPSKPSSVAIAAGCALIFCMVTFVLAKRQGVKTWPVFLTGAAFATSFFVLGAHFLDLRVTGDANRLAPEMDLALILLFAYCIALCWRQRPILRILAILSLCAACYPAEQYLSHRKSQLHRAESIQSRPEFQVTKWMSDNLPGARAFATGSIRYWYNAWHDDEQMYGGSNQGLLHQLLPAAYWQITQGERADVAIAWLQALGVGAIIVPDQTSQEIYHDYSHPEKFRCALPEVYNDHKGVAIYRVPRRSAGMARVVDRAALSAVGAPRAGDDFETLSRYVSVVEHGPDSAPTVTWNALERFEVNASVSAGQALLLQETFDPAWHAYLDGKTLPVAHDAFGFMLVAPPAGTHAISFRFETPLENRIGWVVTAFTCILVLLVLMRGFFRNRRPKSLQAEAPAPPFQIPAEPFDRGRLRAAEDALRDLQMPDPGAKTYLEKHIPRLARTLALVPPPQNTGRVLELGCYMQITPLLDRLCGYREVRGAYFGALGRTDRKIVPFPDREFACDVDCFDAERDRFPYPDGHFDLVIAAEIIEHLTYDPMHLLVEARRVLADNGFLLVTTPNVGSITSVAKTLDGRDNPQIFFLYKRPAENSAPEIGHVREYTAYELGEAVQAAGFEIVQLFTTFIEEYSSHQPLLKLLAENGYSTENRGEQSWCLARKRPDLPVDRYPYFIYSS